MNLKILKELIKAGESETLEFKSTTGQRTEAMKSVCAMLNGLGGFVIFGVTDKGELRGQQVTAKTLTEIANENFYRAGIIEKWGSGTMRIIDWCQEINSPPPQWIERENDTLVIFFPAEKFEVTGQVTGQVVEDILQFCQVPRKAVEIQKFLKLKHRETFQKNYLRPLLAQNLLTLTMPDKPKSRLQQYVVAEEGKKQI